jgi:hypothetical protein
MYKYTLINIVVKFSSTEEALAGETPGLTYYTDSIPFFAGGMIKRTGIYSVRIQFMNGKSSRIEYLLHPENRHIALKLVKHVNVPTKSIDVPTGMYSLLN